MASAGGGVTASLGLGWLVVIAVGGGIVLFSALGLLLARVVRVRERRRRNQRSYMTGLYGLADDCWQPASSSTTTRLTKRRLLDSSSAGLTAIDLSSSRFSSRLSLTRPPVLPPLPLPTYHSFDFLRPSTAGKRPGSRAESSLRGRGWVTVGSGVASPARRGTSSKRAAAAERPSKGNTRTRKKKKKKKGEKESRPGIGSEEETEEEGEEEGEEDEEEDEVEDDDREEAAAGRGKKKERAGEVGGRKSEVGSGAAGRSQWMTRAEEEGERPRRSNGSHGPQDSIATLQIQHQHQPQLQHQHQPQLQQQHQQQQHRRGSDPANKPDDDSGHGRSGLVWFRSPSWLSRLPARTSAPSTGSLASAASDDRPMEVAKTRARPPPAPALQTSRTAPIFRPADGPWVRVRIPGQTHVVPPSATDKDLNMILQSTDLRLRQRPPVSPPKTAVSLPPRSSPSHTPRSWQPASAQRRQSPSPTRTSTARTEAPSFTLSAPSSSSATSIPGPVAEPKLSPQEKSPSSPAITITKSPASGSGSASASPLQQSRPSSAHADWPAKSPVRAVAASSPRPGSAGSQVSSSLSTLYSANEPEEEPARPAEDPFVGARRPSWQTSRQLPSGPRPLRRIKTTSPASISKMMQPSPVAALSTRPISANWRSNPLREEPRSMLMPAPVMLLPPPARSTPSPQPSFVTVSAVSSEEEEEDEEDAATANGETRDTPRAPWTATAKASSGTSSPLVVISPRDSKASAVADLPSSSPYSEEDILAMLLSDSTPRRALPFPPAALAGPDGSVVPTPLAPPPKDGRWLSPSGPPPPTTADSDSASAASSLAVGGVEPGAVSYGSPVRRPTGRSVRDHAHSNTLSSTIAELRRMNSMVSSYSVASTTTSTVAGPMDSPTLPDIFRAPDAPSRAKSRSLKPIGSCHYLSVGRHELRDGAGPKTVSLDLGAARPGRRGRERDKENHRPGREAWTTSTATAPAVLPPSEDKPKLGPAHQLLVEEKRHLEKRDSADSLGLYDKDGFLLSSPEREARKPLRM